MNTVKVTKNPATGNVFTPNAEVSTKDGKQYGYIRVESKQYDFSQAVARVKTRSALKSMLAEDFNKLPLADGEELNGHIIRVDSLEPAYEGHKAMQVPAKNADGELVKDEFSPVLKNGQPVYRQDIFTTDMSLSDVKIEGGYDEIAIFTGKKAAKNTVLAGTKK